jgi:hypothetical protein
MDRDFAKNTYDVRGALPPDKASLQDLPVLVHRASTHAQGL